MIASGGSGAALLENDADVPTAFYVPPVDPPHVGAVTDSDPTG